MSPASAHTPIRVAGARGRKPAKPSPLPFVHTYLRPASPVLAPPQYPIDVTGGFTAWGMLGNGPDPTLTVNGGNPVGNCTFCGRQHYRQCKAASAQPPLSETWETSNQLVTEYLTYDDGQDDGAVIADLLLYWYQQGIIEAFAPVDMSNVPLMDSLMYAFKGLYVGVNLTDDADALFNANQPWTVAQGQQPDPNDGHCIVKARATAPTAANPTDTYLTWGAEQLATKAWSASCTEEVYVIITKEDAEAANLDLVALKADIDALGGTGGAPTPTPIPPPTPQPTPPQPTPTPTPSPTPTPGPVPVTPTPTPPPAPAPTPPIVPPSPIGPPPVPEPSPPAPGPAPWPQPTPGPTPAPSPCPHPTPNSPGWWSLFWQWLELALGDVSDSYAFEIHIGRPGH